MKRVFRSEHLPHRPELMEPPKTGLAGWLELAKLNAAVREFAGLPTEIVVDRSVAKLIRVGLADRSKS